MGCTGFNLGDVEFVVFKTGKSKGSLPPPKPNPPDDLLFVHCTVHF